MFVIPRHTLVNYLRAAADQFESDAQDQPARVAEQFGRQATEARAIADRLETADGILLED
jgi:hypothetical protein